MDMLYVFLKGFHNLLRWVVVLAGAYALVLMARGVFTRAAWTGVQDGAARIFTIGMHTRLLVGIVLYGLTPLVAAGITAPLTGRLMLIEHATTMILAVVAAQLGTSLARRAKDDRGKYRRAFTWYLVAAVFILWATPWGKSLIPWT